MTKPKTRLGQPMDPLGLTPNRLKSGIMLAKNHDMHRECRSGKFSKECFIPFVICTIHILKTFQSIARKLEKNHDMCLSLTRKLVSLVSPNLKEYGHAKWG
eukprot:TRINITY_DN20938_c0_g1_i1.p1 TRINITY_DN20938_c0_g1~~TRINITY_DN20938_c0_g1_i1.p1  ORF type:complete len:101 (-),score=6.42 TRINITY_DN20938_c0_g1_i1:54-356(-)